MDRVKSSELRVQSYKKILIIRLDRIGDVLLSTPVIKALRDAYPASHIAVMVQPYANDIVKGNPYLNEVILYDKNGSEKALFGNIDFILKLRRRKFDIALILHPTRRTHIVAFLAGIPERVGYNKKWGFFLTRRIPHTKQFGLKHERDYTLDILRYIGIEPLDGRLHMPLNKRSEFKIGEIFRQNGITEHDLIVTLNPGASCPSKRWHPEKFGKIGDILARDYNAKIVVIAGLKDKESGDMVAGYIDRRSCVNLSGRTSVADLASVLKRSRLFISNDSGPVHIASSIGTPVIAIFGRNERGLSPERWRPLGERDIVLHKDVGCDACLAHNCKIGFKCLSSITVDDVLDAARMILKGPSPTPGVGDG